MHACMRAQHESLWHAGQGTATNGEQGRPPRAPTSSRGAHTLAHPFPPILHLSKTDICARQPARALACILFLIVCVACSDDTLAPRAKSALLVLACAGLF